MITEAHIQAVLMGWLLDDKQHPYIVPNSREFFRWEADLLSITKSNLVHEYEIKLNIYDFKADAKKRKHFWLGDASYSPAYFWYVTYAFDIEPPEKAGWILITQVNSAYNYGWKLEIKKPAPRLNQWKPDKRRMAQIGRLLTWRLYHQLRKSYLETDK